MNTSSRQDLAKCIAALRPRPTSALFLTFEISLPFVERVVLPALGQQLSSLDIIVDSTAYADCTSDGIGVSKAGIAYRLHSAKTRNGYAFHPKMLLLRAPGVVHALIMSANLTSGGWQRNFEVVDVLTFTADKPSEDQARRELLAFLRDLPHCLVSTTTEMLTAIDSAVADLAALKSIADDSSLDSEISVLHSLRHPLFEQIEQLIPGDLARKITLYSPYFDRNNEAIKEFARYFSNAEIRVVKEGSIATDFDGKSFIALGDRCRLHSIRYPEGEGQRRLHAKCVLLEADTESWLICGSANLSAAGWLATSHGRGNVELVTVRHRTVHENSAQLSSSLHDLFEGIDLVAVDPSTQTYTKNITEDEQRQRSPLFVIEAAERDDEIVVSWTHGALHTDTGQAELLFVAADRDFSQRCDCVQRDGAWFTTLSPVPPGLAKVFVDESAVAVVVKQVNSVGIVQKGRVWLHRTDLLAESNDVRDLRRRLSMGFGPMSSPRTGLDAMMALLELARSDQSVFDAGVDDRMEDAQEVRDTTGNSSRLGTRRGRKNSTESTFVAVRKVLQKLLSPSLRDSRKNRFSMHAMREAESFNQDADEFGVGEDESEHPYDEPLDGSSVSRVEWANACASFVDVARMVSSDKNPAHARRNASILIYLTSLIVGIEWGKALETDSENLQAVRETREAVWNVAWSLRGWETGRADSWIARTLSDSPSSLAIRSLLIDTQVTARMITLASAVAILDKKPATPDVSLILSLALETSLKFDEAPLCTLIDSHISDLVESSRIGVSAPELVATLPTADVRTTEGWVIAHTWLPLHLFVNGTGSSEDAFRFAPDEVRRLFAPIMRRPDARSRFSYIQERVDGRVCKNCNTRMPSERSRRSTVSLRNCENCNLFLIPADFSSPLTAAILGMVAPEVVSEVSNAER